MLKMIEDVPEFFIQISFFIVGEYDVFTAANLAFTILVSCFEDQLLSPTPWSDSRDVPTAARCSSTS